MLDSICIIHQYAYAENVVITRGPINMGTIMIMMIGTWDVDLASMIVIQLL